MLTHPSIANPTGPLKSSAFHLHSHPDPGILSEAYLSSRDPRIMGYHGPRRGGASASIIARRTSLCLTLSRASIPYVLWGEDALRFAFDVPTELFDTVYILISSGRLHDASSVITNGFPYTLSLDRQHRLPGSVGTAPLPECLGLQCSQPYSPCPRKILLISDHLLHFDTTDPKSMRKLHLEPFRSAGVEEGDWLRSLHCQRTSMAFFCANASY